MESLPCAPWGVHRVCTAGAMQPASGSSNQPCKSAHEEQLVMQLWAHLCDPEEARNCFADGASLDEGKMVHCFHESETKSCLSPVIMKADNHMLEFHQLK